MRGRSAQGFLRDIPVVGERKHRIRTTFQKLYDKRKIVIQSRIGIKPCIVTKSE